MIRTKTYPLPLTIKAFTVPDIDGDYDVIINADLNDEAKERAFRHELSHIHNNDFENDCADDIEKERHK